VTPPPSVRVTAGLEDQEEEQEEEEKEKRHRRLLLLSSVCSFKKPPSSSSSSPEEEGGGSALVQGQAGHPLVVPAALHTVAVDVTQSIAGERLARRVLMTSERQQD